MTSIQKGSKKGILKTIKITQNIPSNENKKDCLIEEYKWKIPTSHLK